MFDDPNDSSTSISAPPFHLFPAVQSANQYAATGFGMRTRVSQRMSLPRSAPPDDSFHFATMLPLPASCADAETVLCAAVSGLTWASIELAVHSRFGRVGSSTG